MVLYDHDSLIFVSRGKLIALLGEELAQRVIDIFGGARVWLPEPDSEGFRAVALKLGDEAAARKLCHDYGGNRIALPMRLLPIHEQIVRLAKDEKLGATAIARRLGCSDRQVYRALRRLAEKEA
jgi:hypothetical protein